MKYSQSLLSFIAIGLLVLCLVSSPTLASVFIGVGSTGYLYFQLIQSGQFNYLPLGEGAALHTPALVWGQ